MAISSTLSEVFQNQVTLPVLKFLDPVKGSPVTTPSQIDVGIAHDHPHLALQEIIVFDLDSQLQEHFDEAYALSQVEDGGMKIIEASQASIEKRMAAGIGSEEDLKIILLHLFDIVVTGANSAITEGHQLEVGNVNQPPRSDLVLNVNNKANGHRTPLVVIMKFGRPEKSGRTLLGDVVTTLRGHCHVQFPGCRDIYPHAKFRSAGDLSTTLSGPQVDADLPLLKLPPLGDPAKVKFEKGPWSLIDQFWSQMVALDLTWGVFTDWGETHIGLRVRKTGRLYLSEPIEPASLLAPCSALLLLAFQDHADRQMKRTELAESTTAPQPPQDDTNPNNKDSSSPDEGGTDQPTGKEPKLSPTVNTSAHQPAPSSSSAYGLNLVPRLGQRGREDWSKKNSFRVLGRLKMTNLVPAELSLVFRTARLCSPFVAPLFKQHSPHKIPAGPSIDALSSSSPATKHGTTSGGSEEGSQIAPRRYDPEIGLDGYLVLFEEVGRGASGQVWRGYLDLGPTGSISVVAKAGKFKEMELERDVYTRLEQQSVDGVPMLLGLYRTTEGTPEWPFGFLVMSDEGEPVEDGELSNEESEVFEEILDQIHGAGIFHNDIRRENLLRAKDLNGQVRLTIIDFHLANAVPLSGRVEEMQSEKEELQALLACLRSGLCDD